MSIHVVVGSGPLGKGTARKLVALGESVRLVSRNPPSGIDGVESFAADATSPESLRPALEGAAVVYNCTSAPYHRWTQDLPPVWRGVLDATRKAGARLVIGTNLYAFGAPTAPFTEESPNNPCSSKGRVRAMLETEALEAHHRGELEVAIVRGSDFYGPGVTNSSLGDRFFAPTVTGKPATLTGLLDVPHSYTYLPDFADTMAVVGTRDDTWGRNWIVPSAPPVTGREMEVALRGALGEARGALSEVQGVTVRSMGLGMLRFGGLFVPAARAMVEMYYQFDRPFTVDSSRSERTLGLAPTPLDRGFAETVQWFASPAIAGETSARVGQADGR